MRTTHCEFWPISHNFWPCTAAHFAYKWVNWLLNVTVNNIPVIYMYVMTHMGRFHLQCILMIRSNWAVVTSELHLFLSLKFIKYWIWYMHLISEMHICVNRISRQYMEYKLLRNEFYLFVSHGGMNDRGSTCKFRNAQRAFQNLHVDPLSFIPPWETNKKN